MAIRRSLMVSRGLQLVGVALMVAGIVAYSQRDTSRFMAQAFLGGMVLILGARIYEWLTKEWHSSSRPIAAAPSSTDRWSRG